MAKDTCERHRSLFTASFDPQLKKRFIKRFVWGVFLYGSETCMDSQESRHEKNRRFGDVDMAEPYSSKVYSIVYIRKQDS